MISYLAILIVFLAIVAVVFYVITYFIYPDLPRGITTIYVLVLILGGTQLLSLAIISEYIGKILEETKTRPKFIIEKIYNDPGKKILRRKKK